MFFERLKVACVQKGTSPTTLLKKLGMSTSSVTAWKRGVSPSIGTIYRLAEALAVDPKMLLDDGQPMNLETENAPVLTEKDRRDVAKDVARIMSSLEDSGELMFDGVPMSDEARASMAAAMRIISNSFVIMLLSSCAFINN